MPALNRRRVLLLGAVVVAVAPLCHVRADTGASAAVKKYTERLTAVVNGPGSDSDKRPKLQAIVDEAVDVPAVAQFCLGRYWQAATPQQRTEFNDVFRRTLLISLTGQISQYEGVTVAVSPSHPGGDGAGETVPSVVTRPNNAPAHVDWVMNAANKVVDVVAEGTSLRLTTRSDYSSFLAGHGGNVQALIDAMKQKIAT